MNGGLAGLAAGFPLALYMFIGWENGPALAEETREPARTIPRALYISIAAATALFVLFAYTTIVGFHYETCSIGRASVPFLEMADRYLGSAAILAWLAGIFSVLATLVAAANSQARVLFDGGRSGLLPARLGTSRPPGETPVAALLRDDRVRPGHRRGLVAVPRHRPDRRIERPGQPVRRVLDDGHDPDPVRVRPDRGLAAGVHPPPRPAPSRPCATA